MMEMVLVIGGAGFIGSHTVDALLRKGYAVRILDSLCPPTHRGARPGYLPDAAEFRRGDVQNREDVESALAGVSIVFNFAAYQDYLTDFSRFFRVNAAGTALVYEVIVEKRLPIRKMIVASSQAVYGEGTYRCPTDGIVVVPRRPLERLRLRRWEVTCPACDGPLTLVPSTETRAQPHNPYGISKYTQDLIALSLGERYGIPTVTLRYSIVQGPRQSHHNAYSGALRIFALSLHHGKPLTIYEDGRQLRDYVNIEDVVRANLLVLEDPRAEGQTYNVGGGRAYMVLDLARVVAGALGKEPAIAPTGAFRFGDSRHMISDITKIAGLGWRPQRTLDESVRDYVAWMLEETTSAEVLDRAQVTMGRAGVVLGPAESMRA